MINPNAIYRAKFKILEVRDWADSQELTIEVNGAIVKTYGPSIRLNKRGKKKLLLHDNLGKAIISNIDPLQVNEVYSGQFKFSIIAGRYILLKVSKQYNKGI